MKPFRNFRRLVALLAIGISTAEVGCWTRAVASSPDVFLEVVSAEFLQWDANHDGVLSTNELDAAVASVDTKGKPAAAIAALKRASRSTRYKLPALTLENIRQVASAAAAADKPDFSRMFTEGFTRITNATSRELFVSGMPKLETIHQGKLGNCFCLAPLGAMVHRDPRQVAGLFSPQEDGRYRVTLGKQTVRIAPPTDAEIAMTASNERDGIWVNLYEKAVGAALNETRPADQRAGSPMDVLARGGSAGTMLAFITGHEIERFSFRFSKDAGTKPADREAKLIDLRRQLAVAVRENRLMTCGTLKTTTPGLTPGHAYAVLGYDAKTDLVKLWNPHGGSFTPKGPTGLAKGYPMKDGVFQMPVADWVQQFSGMAFEVTAVAAK